MSKLDSLPIKPSGSREAPPPQPPEIPEESSAQALSEALSSSFAIVKVVMLGLVVLFLISGARIVGPQEKAIRLRFGKPVGEGDAAMLGPGLHWAFPPPIDRLVRIPVGQVQTAHSTIGWYQTTPAMEAARNEPPPGESLNPINDGYALTADGNIIHVRGAVRYRIAEPGLKYQFDFQNASNLVQLAFNNSLVFAAAHYSVDDALTRDQVGFREKVRERLENLIDQQGLGVIIDQIELQTIPPRQLKTHFDAVLEAEVKRGQVLNQARSHANQTLSQAQAESAGLTNAAHTDARRMVEQVSAEAQRFSKLLPSYRIDPQLFTRLHQTEVLRRVVTNAQDRWVLTRQNSGRTPELRLQLNREPDRVKGVAPTPGDH